MIKIIGKKNMDLPLEELQKLKIVVFHLTKKVYQYFERKEDEIIVRNTIDWFKKRNNSTHVY